MCPVHAFDVSGEGISSPIGRWRLDTGINAFQWKKRDLPATGSQELCYQPRCNKTVYSGRKTGSVFNIFWYISRGPRDSATAVNAAADSATDAL